MPRVGAKQVIVRMEISEPERDAISWDMKGRVAPLTAAVLSRYFRDTLNEKIRRVSDDYAARAQRDTDHE